MSQEFLAILDYMEKEKGIDKAEMIEVVREGLISASRKTIGENAQVRVDLNPKTGKIRAFASFRITDRVLDPSCEITPAQARQRRAVGTVGDIVEIEIPPQELGRIAAQVFKQAVHQSMRSIERSKIFEEFKDRQGDIVTGTVRRFDRSDIIVDLGRFEAVLPSKERVATEEYNVGDRIRAMILEVGNNTRGPEIVLSRSHPNFVRRLFELEVSELHDKTVEIKAMAREAGQRTKIAVWSNDEKIDPVGACVGIRGARVKNIVRELNNEKIDLFRWSPNIRDLVIESLKPAKLRRIEVDEATHRVKVLVDEENLSLAIGRRGQNARLTSKLTGWDIDIEKENVVEMGFAEKLEQAVQTLAARLSVDVEIARKVASAGFLTVEGIREVDLQDLKDACPDVDPPILESIYTTACQPPATQ